MRINSGGRREGDGQSFGLGGGIPPIPLVGKILKSSLWHVFGKKKFFSSVTASARFYRFAHGTN